MENSTPICLQVPSIIMLKCLSVAVLCLVAVSSAVQPKFEFVEEWQLWKARHSKIYDTEILELERHLTWLSNKKYIEQHNANSHIFGFTLAMNRFGDMVRDH